RIARDQGRVDVFDGLIEHLRTVAPDDEQVRALAMPSVPPQVSSLPPQVSSAPPQYEEAVALSVDDGEVEVIEEQESEAAPIPLLGGRPTGASVRPPQERPSRAAPSAPVAATR